jgi:hypothetical protein
VPAGAHARGMQFRVGEVFVLAKAIAGIDKVKVRDLPRSSLQLTFVVATDNLIRMPRLLAEAA